MPQNHPTPEQQGPGGLPAPGTASTPSPGPADRVHKRQLEKSVSWSGLERLRCLWYRLRLTHADISYANRRIFELQAPWTADPQWHTRTDDADAARRSG